MNQRRLWRIGARVTVVVLIVSAMIVAWPRSGPKWRRPQIVVRFIGMTTNDALAMRQAKFEVRNADNRELCVGLPGQYDVGPRGGGFWFTNVLLKPGAALETGIVPPLTRDRWRAEFVCSVPLNVLQRLKNRAADHGWPVLRTGQVVTHAYSDWVEPTEQINWMDWLQQPLLSTNAIPHSPF